MSTIYTRATKGAALTWTEGDANITNLNTDKLENIVEDTTPQLGGNLDVGTNTITTTVIDGDIVLAPEGTGIVVALGDLIVGYGTQTAAITSSGSYDLDLVTNGGVDSGFIRIVAGVNGNILLQPNGTGDVQLSADTVTVGDSNANATITTNGTGDLILSTNSGTNSGLIRILNGVDNDIQLIPNGTGKVHFETSETRVGINNTNAKITTKGTGDLTLDTNSGTNSGSIVIADAANGNISITPNGTGQTVMKNIEYNEFIHSLGTTGGTIAPNVTNGNVQTITLNAALTINAFTSPVAGQSLTLIINGGTAYTSITSTMKFAGGIKTLTGTAGCVDILSVFYDGTNYYASLGKGFA